MSTCQAWSASLTLVPGVEHQVWDSGAVAWCAGEIEVHHPANDPARNELYYRLNARNRVLRRPA